MKNKNVRMVLSISLNVILIIFGVYVIFTVGTKAYGFGSGVFDEKAVDSADYAREVEVTITDNISASQLGKILYDKKLISDKTIFYVQVKLSDYKDKFKAGTYTLSSDMTPTEMMKVLSDTTDKDEDS